MSSASATPAASTLRTDRDAGGPLLRVRDLDVSYARAVRALRGVSLEVPPGGVVAVLGGNGAGKSTLLRAISGTLPAVGGAIGRGSVELDGRRLDRADPAAIVRAGVVQVPEGRQVFGELTVEENLRAGALATARRARGPARHRVYELFPVLAGLRQQRAGLLSGGEQQMLAIGRALMAAPRVLLLDEPSLGLAPRMVARIGEVLAEIHRQGTAVVLVEQNAALALDLADVAYVLEVGRVTLHGPAAELAATEEVRHRYLGVGAPATAPAVPAPAAAPAADRELVVDGLSVRFGGVAALSEVSLSVEPGSVHALIGPNGAGKSTCLNVLTGVYRAAAGSVRYAGVELTGLRPHRIAALGVGRTFQNLALSPTATVADNLLLGRHRLTRAGFLGAGLRIPRARREQSEQDSRVREIAGLLELAEVLDRPVAALPYGDRKRVELARALCAEPTLLLLDEPVAGMNADESARLTAVIARVRAELGISILLVEHDMTFVMGLADTVTVLDFGKRIACGTPEQVQRDPEVIRAYLGGAP
ncbi:MAG TPA: ATP-binding cassette domain-containing protein [Actinophytocola sp.]|nr:ATP-binding cassette domain-containing protein [Actinophytocola sp.]